MTTRAPPRTPTRPWTTPAPGLARAATAQDRDAHRPFHAARPAAPGRPVREPGKT
ncbi:hypothetical protein [Streptomyces rishiriensis]|uniref:Uncharacterized protein n=1 Tax=Streptomyces rishiriensis TaxID=68264 RepID=A0ABU0NMH8_STRRH|nr:hypothetical protein [Streptomyces rishiriensis]MDQ0579988.1 hypothetical protein [Streptomyces rishiriensis]